MAGIEAQKQIRDNALELQDFLQDLKSWEHSIKHKDQQVKSQAGRDKNVAPIRGQAENASGSSSQQQVLSSTNNRSGKMDQANSQMGIAEQNQALTAAKLSHDYFRNKWDKFDVEANEAATTKSISDVQRPPSKDISNNPGRSSPSKIEATSRAEKQSDTLGLRDSGPDAISEKDAGNQFYKEKKYVKAIESYSRSIALRPTAVAYANRAMALLKIRRFGDAETDCTEAISLDDRYVKAYARRGTARQELKQYSAAIRDFEFALRLEPENKELERQYKAAKEAYEKDSGIISSGEKVKIPLSKGVSNVHVPSRPTGPEASRSEQVKVNVPVRSVKDAIASTQAAAARAAASATAGVARSLVAPRTSYEFEATWKSLAGDRSSQGRLLKMLKPASLPSLFKDSLAAPLMIDLIETLALFFPDDASFAVEVLEHLPKVGRFSMSVLSFTSKQKTALSQLWDGAFRAGVSDELIQRLDVLRGAYRLQ